MAVRSAPGRGRAEWGLIRAAGEERQGYRGKGYWGSAGRFGRPLDQLGEPHRQFDTLADLLVAGSLGSGGLTQFLYAGQQRFHVLAQKLLAEWRVGSRTGELVFGDRRISTHGRRLVNSALWRRVIRPGEIINTRLSLCYLGRS